MLGSEKVHDHIVFKAVDIQDLFVLGERIASGGVGSKSASSQQQKATLIDDPAIVSQSPPALFQVTSRSAPPPQPRRPGFVDQEPDFDFESANQQFQREALDCDDPNRRFPGGGWFGGGAHIMVSDIDPVSADSSSLPGSMKRNEVYYDKKVSFFDTISTGTRTRGRYVLGIAPSLHHPSLSSPFQRHQLAAQHEDQRGDVRPDDDHCRRDAPGRGNLHASHAVPVAAALPSSHADHLSLDRQQQQELPEWWDSSEALFHLPRPQMRG